MNNQNYSVECVTDSPDYSNSFLKQLPFDMLCRHTSYTRALIIRLTLCLFQLKLVQIVAQSDDIEILYYHCLINEQ